MRRYERNDWWDLMTVIEQELERDNSYKTYLNIADELKWRMVDSVSEGGNHKIKKKMIETKERFLSSCQGVSDLTLAEKEEIDALFDFVLSWKPTSN